MGRVFIKKKSICRAQSNLKVSLPLPQFINAFLVQVNIAFPITRFLLTFAISLNPNPPVKFEKKTDRAP